MLAQLLCTTLGSAVVKPLQACNQFLIGAPARLGGGSGITCVLSTLRLPCRQTAAGDRVLSTHLVLSALRLCAQMKRTGRRPGMFKPRLSCQISANAV